MVAPFEGLYRQSGYEALEAVRLAITDCTPPNLDVMPLALDDGNDPVQTRRAVGKLLSDPTVLGMVGPMNIAGIAAVADLLATADTTWIVPGLHTTQTEFADPASTADWLFPLVASAPLSNTTRLVVGGVSASLLPMAAGMTTSVPIIMLSTIEPSSLAVSDTLLWLGDAHEAAGLVSKLAVPPHLVMAIPMGSHVFNAHATREIGQQIDWLAWLDSEYNQWIDDHAPATPTAYLHYQATCAMLMSMSRGSSGMGQTQSAINRIRMNADGGWAVIDNTVP